MEIEKNPPEEPQEQPEEEHTPTSLSDEPSTEPAVEQAEDDAPTSLPDEPQGQAELKPEAEEATLSLPDETQEQPDAKLAEEETLVVLPGEQPETLELTSLPTRGRSGYARWVQVLAAVLLVALLAGGAISYALTRQSSSSKATHVAHSMKAAVKPLQVNNWCVTNGAQVDPQAGQLRLHKVVALAPNDAWLLGSLSKSDESKHTSQTTPLLEHWNGTSWTVVPSADTSALLTSLKGRVTGDADESVTLNDMVALSANDIWDVGSISVSRIHPLTSFLPTSRITFDDMFKAAGQTVIEHWDGSTWQVVASPDGPDTPLHGYGDTLNSITAVSAHDIWAVGSQGGFLGGAPLVRHWDGLGWHIVQLPGSLQRGGLAHVQARSANDVWVFGTDQKPVQLPVSPGSLPGSVLPKLPPNATVTVSYVGFQSTPVVLHWDGQNWSTVKLPDVLHNGTLADEAVVAANNIWVIGHAAAKAPGSNNGVVLSPGDTSGIEAAFTGVSPTSIIQHWDGNQWSSVSGPTDLSKDGTFSTITATGANDVWLMGSTKDGKPLLEHWDGKAWHLLSPTSPTTGQVTSIATAGDKAWTLVSPIDLRITGPYQFVAKAKSGQPQSTPATPAMVLETNC